MSSLISAPSPDSRPDRARERELAELRLLLNLSQLLDENPDLSESGPLVLQTISEHVDMMRGAIYILRDESAEITIEAAFGLSESALQRGVYGIGEGVVGQVIASGEPAIVPKVSEESRFLNRTGARADVPKEEISFICVPVKQGSKIIGALSADQIYDSDQPLEDDLGLLQTVATMIAQAVWRHRELQKERHALLEENRRLHNELKSRYRPSNIIGNSKAMQVVYDHISRVGTSDCTVLIRGESGVGKELVAQAIHYESSRSSRPFVKVNCAALSPSLLESELFGHEQGAFTGATKQRIGRFEMANSGTIFLDEIGDFPMSTQIMLLRFLQEREFERVGGGKTIRADVRIIAATNRNLEDAIASGDFREDLYYRLNVFPIYVPPLRDRPTDISLLADYFAGRYSKINNKTITRISTPAIDMLTSYHWPGNVRELENCIERAVLLSDNAVIHGHHLPPTLQTAEATGTNLKGTLEEVLGKIEREMILESLKTHRGNMRAAARELGVTERIMGLRVKQYEINPKRFRHSMSA